MTEKEIKVLDKGFVRLIDVYGSDDRIADAARNSYQSGTKKLSDNETLIRHLMRHSHTSPLEFCEVTFQLYMPLAISTQLIRHRTFNFNFESLRYSESKCDFYIPEEKDITLQSESNKQGGGNTQATLENIQNPDDFVDSHFGLSDFYSDYKFSSQFSDPMEVANSYYQKLLKSKIRREICRFVLPVATYTKCYAKVDLNNFFKFLKLRLDSAAQQEMRLYAEAMFSLIKQHFPIACAAFKEYQLNALTLHEKDIVGITELLSSLRVMENMCMNTFSKEDKEVLISKKAEDLFTNKREREEFLDKLKKLGIL